MDTPQPGRPEDDMAATERAVPAAEPVGAGVGSTPGRSSSPGPGSTANDFGNRLNSATSRVENSAAAARAQGYLTPLEQFGRQPIAWVGSALVFIGVFLPVKTYSVSAGAFSVNVSWNLWDLNALWGIVVLVAALASAFVAWQRDYRLLWITGGVIAVAELVNLLFTFSAPAFASAHPSWGWILLIPGVLLILAAALLRSNPSEPRGDAVAYVQNLINRR
jgi:hypothetical protein